MHGRLEDVVPALIDEAAADEDDGRDLKQVRQLADRVEDDDVGARLGVDGELGAPHDAQALGARERFGLGEALGLARRDDRAAPSGARGARRRTPPAPALSSPLSVLAAMNTGRDRRNPEVPQHAARRRGPAAAAGDSSESNFRLPVTITRAGSAPMSMMRRADSSLCMQNRSTSASTRRKNPRASR